MEDKHSKIRLSEMIVTGSTTKCLVGALDALKTARNAIRFISGSLPHRRTVATKSPANLNLVDYLCK